jgi:hypothetical protein
VGKIVLLVDIAIQMEAPLDDTTKHPILTTTIIQKAQPERTRKPNLLPILKLLKKQLRESIGRSRGAALLKGIRSTDSVYWQLLRE